MLKKEKACPEQSRRILVAMSGGVDSSVAAALLVKQGYEVTGMFAVNYDDLSPSAREGVAKGRGSGSCWVSDYQDALRVAAHLGIPLLRWDFTKEYKKMVLDHMYKEYSAGRTPNPDILCNKFVKFGVWLNKARKMGYDKIATGHYAQIRNKEKGMRKKGKLKKLLLTPYSLLLSKDTNKDQTYFLHQLSQKQLAHVLFPIGNYTKPEVRKLATKFKLPTAYKEESMGICFIGEVPMKDFLEKRIKAKPGNVVLTDGTVVGIHEGLGFYTIGQRHNGFQNSEFRFQNSETKPMFVISKNLKKNQLIIGYDNDPLLYNEEIVVKNINWIRQTPNFPLKCRVRLRHRQEMQNAIIKKTKKQENKKTVIVELTKPQRAVTPGQFAVFYLKGECLGGGVIK